jgi:hypothetical protein
MVLSTLVLEEVDFLKVLKCDAGEVWRRHLYRSYKKMKHSKELRRKGTSHVE